VTANALAVLFADLYGVCVGKFGNSVFVSTGLSIMRYRVCTILPLRQRSQVRESVVPRIEVDVVNVDMIWDSPVEGGINKATHLTGSPIGTFP
jgi:hypothetical protein